MSKRSLIVIAVCYSVWIAAVIAKAFPDPQCTDFYPLWIGSRALLAGTDPYSAAVSHTLQQSWSVAQTHQVAACVAYPLPWLLLISPLAMLPLSWAGPLWFALSLTLLLGGLWLLGNEIEETVWREGVLLAPLLFYPIFHAAVIKTASVAILGIVALMLWADRKEHRVLCGILMALSLCKPQVSLVFVGYLILRQLRGDKLTLISFMAAGFFSFGGSLIVHPGWVGSWLAVLKVYLENAVTFSLLPQGLFAAAVLLLRRVPALAQLSLLQTVLFPACDLYSALPLGIGWLTLKGGCAPLVACSWLAPLLYEHPNNLGAIWGFVILPYLLSALLVQAPNQPFSCSCFSRASR
jgi:hypothetical protein